jgi:subtilisin family serine protease
MVNYKPILFSLLFSLFLTPIFGQTNLYKYVVFLTDKNGSPYSLDAPDEFLSEAALARRIQYNITIQENDLPVVENYIDALTSLGLTVLSSSKWLNAVLVQSTSALNVTDLEAETFIKEVVYVALSMPGGRKLKTNPSNTNAFVQSNPNRDYGLAMDQIKMLNGQFLHNNGFGGENMLIAVLDAGFKHVDELSAFLAVRNEQRVLATKDFVDYDTDVYHGSTHGMSVLGTMTASIDFAYLGTAPKANYILIRTEDSDTEQLIEEFNYVLGLEYADSMGAQVVNTSLGYTTFNDTAMNHAPEELDGDHLIASVGADLAAGKGMLIVNSAGNKGNTDWKYISFPSDGDSVLTVGSVNRSFAKSNFSGFGFDEYPQIKPNVMALGEQVAVIRPDGSIGNANGTSFSSPIIAGLAACLWQSFPEMNNMDIINAIQESSSQYRSPDYEMGYGIPDFQAAFSLLYQKRFNLNAASNNILIFPNPFNNHITLTLPDAIDQPFLVSLYNEMGQQFLNETIQPGSRKTIDIYFDHIATLNKGLYFLKVKTNNEVFMFKLVKL